MQRTRKDVLLSGWLWLAVAVTAANDHVLKVHTPSVLTGKLSDVAGVAMLALVGAAMVRSRWALVAVGVGFTALKTVPGAAELAAPILGGVTLRDPTDLIALAVLAPLWWWLSTPAQVTEPTPPDPTPILDHAQPVARGGSGPAPPWPRARRSLPRSSWSAPRSRSPARPPALRRRGSPM